MKDFFSGLERQNHTGSHRAAKEEVYIFGAGRTGRYIAERLNDMPFALAGFIDDNPAFANTLIFDVMVLKPEELALKDKNVKVIVANSMEHMEGMKRRCHQLGLTNTITPDQLFVRYGCLDQIEKLESDPAAKAAMDIWEDAESAAIYKAMARHRVTFDLAEIPTPFPHQYFELGLHKNEAYRSFVDCGAFIGDTLQEFKQIVNNEFDNYYAFEPEEAAYRQLCREAGDDRRIKTFSCALGSSRAEVSFSSMTPGFSEIAEWGGGGGGGKITVDRLDSILGCNPVSMIKMDLEGAEPEALEGASGIIKAQRPLLAICVYHFPEHLWQIPLQIHRFDCGYKLYLRTYRRGHAESVCYAVPERYAKG